MMFGRGKGMGGGAGGGANMLRTVGRTAVATARAGVTTGNPTTFQEPLPSTPSSPTSASQRNKNSNSYLSISSGTSAFGSCNSGVPISANSGLPSNWPVFAASPASTADSCCDEFEWVSVDESDEDKPNGVFDDFVLGPVPSDAEVQNVVSALQRVFDASSGPQLIRDKFSYNASKDITYQNPSPTGSMHQVHSAGSELNCKEPSLHVYNTGALQPYGSNRVYDAFHLLQTEPMVQKMVSSLSSDEAVWKAVLNNDVVRELRKSYYAAKDYNPLSSDESSDENSDETNKTTNIVKWIFDNTKAKVMDIFEKIKKLVNDLFKLPLDNETATAGTPDPFEERLRTSFLLSVVVLLIVVVTRGHTA